MRLPGPVAGGPAVSLMWSAPSRDVIAAPSGETRPGWRSTLFGSVAGYPEYEIGEAQSLDRVTLRLAQVYGTLRVALALLLARVGIGGHDDDEDDT